MINHKYEFIFVRVAKTASTSMLSPLFNDTKHQNPKGHILSQIAKRHFIDVSEYWNDDPHHYPLEIIKKVVSAEIYDSYYKFGFVRNPWARAISAYKYAVKWHQSRDSYNQYPEFATFKRWILSIKRPFHKYGEQYAYVKGCDFIGKLENIQRDFDIVCDKIGIPRQQLPHKNKTNHKHYTEYYDDETKEIVAEKYAKDIEYFGYEFGE